MIIRAASTSTFPIDACHGGVGAVVCRKILGNYDQETPGFKYIHEDILEPGVSIGEHQHSGDEEIYWIMEGEGTMTLDGETLHVEAGDVCVIRDGQSHSLLNSGSGPMRLLVVATQVRRLKISPAISASS